MNNKFLLASALCMSMSATMNAQNPIVQTQLTSDPAPLPVGDRLYVYAGHDEDKADFFWMNEWRVYSTTDMVNWTDHGSPLDLSSFSWADDRAWAAQTIERNGKYYWYICAHSKLTGYNVRKFLVSKSVSPEYNTNPANFVVYRYADVLLMKAEATNRAPCHCRSVW